jgi:plastocyanin
VVTLRPSTGGPAAPPAEVAVLDQLGLAFTPSQLLVRLGQPAEVVNSESLAHNVHVTFADTDSTVLLADMNSGDRMELDLDQEGGYDVVCDVHPGMRAFIYVTSAPYAVFAAADGSFLIPDVPPGSYTVSVWSADVGARSERSVQVSGTSTELDLSASR